MNKNIYIVYHEGNNFKIRTIATSNIRDFRIISGSVYINYEGYNKDSIFKTYKAAYNYIQKNYIGLNKYRYTMNELVSLLPEMCNVIILK